MAQGAAGLPGAGRPEHAALRWGCRCHLLAGGAGSTCGPGCVCGEAGMSGDQGTACACGEGPVVASCEQPWPRGEAGRGGGVRVGPGSLCHVHSLHPQTAPRYGAALAEQDVGGSHRKPARLPQLSLWLLPLCALQLGCVHLLVRRINGGKRGANAVLVAHVELFGFCIHEHAIVF